MIPSRLGSSASASVPLVRLVPPASLPAWAVSLAVHSALLLAAFLLVQGPPSVSGPEDQVESEIVIQLGREAAAPLDPPTLVKAPSATPVSPLDADPSPKSVGDPFEPILQTDQRLPSRLDPLGPLGGDLASAGAFPLPKVNLPGPVGAAETKFFNTAGKGTKFVYVIDRSASMHSALPLAKAELLASLDKLPPTAEFQVVFYDLEAQVMAIDGQQTLVPATKLNKDKAARMLEYVRSEGGTDHIRALKKALTLRPQVIYFLTDADELKPHQVEDLTQLNQRDTKAHIHCIELSLANAHSRDNPMRILARENRGQYQSVDLIRLLRERER